MNTTTKPPVLENLIDPKNSKLNFTLFPKGIFAVGTHIPFSDTLASLFDKHIITESKDSVPVFMSGKIRTGGKRCDEDVESLEAVVLDYDKLSDDQLTKLTLKIKNISHIIYTTHRHQEKYGVARVRIIIILSRPVAKAEYKIVHKAITDEIKKELLISVDPSSNTPSQAYYLPSCPAARAVNKFITFNTGTTLDVNQALKNANFCQPKIKTTYAAIKWNDSNLKTILSKCSALNELYHRAIIGTHLGHIERRTLGQLLVSVSMPLDMAVAIYSRLEIFNPHRTLSNLKSIKSPPACKKVADNLELCTGCCENIKKIRGGSPIAFINKPA